MSCSPATPTRRWRCVAEPTEDERALLGAFRYSRNLAVLHTDETLMPRRRAVWASWNYIGGESARRSGSASPTG